jgi:hypothetical protein
MARQWLTPGGRLVSGAATRQWMTPGGILIGESGLKSVGTSAGVATVAGVGKVKDKSVGTSASVAAVAGVGKVKDKSVGSTSGSAATAGVGKVKTKSAGSAAGTTRGRDRTIRVWGGHGVFKINGSDYLPLGDRGFAQQTSGAIGGIAQGMTLSLSGVEPAALALLDADEVKAATVVVYRLIFAPDGKTLLDAHIFDRGRGDEIDVVDTIGRAATINFAVESTARGLGRAGSRMRSDWDQRLINPLDGYLRNVAYAPSKMLYWGGKKPSRADAALGGSGSGTGSSGNASEPLTA